VTTGALKSIAAELLCVAASLVVVGLVSGTPIRHLIQVAPVVAAAVCAARSLPWAKDAALAILAFWLIIMLFIWSFLLGLPSPTSGTFSPTEIALTIIIGIACLAGIAAWWRAPSAALILVRIAAFGTAFALQVAALWLSLKSAFEHR
jgi:hypothetical protein